MLQTILNRKKKRQYLNSTVHYKPINILKAFKVGPIKVLISYIEYTVITDNTKASVWPAQGPESMMILIWFVSGNVSQR